MRSNKTNINSYKTLITILLFIITSFITFSQIDSSSTTSYRNNFILFNDLGFNTAPLNIESDQNKIPIKAKFRNNIHDFYGIGCHYRWLSLRLNIQLPGSIKPTKDYGPSKYFHLGFDFTYKKMFFDVDFYRYRGFALLDAYKFNPSKSINDTPNDIESSLISKSFSINMWFFYKKNFSMSALRGKTAVFNKSSFTWYVKSTINSFGINNNESTILPFYLNDPSNSKTSSTLIRAFDIGLVPGLAYAYIKGHWNISALGGYGLVIQEKSFHTNQTIRYFIGLAPRFDIRFIGGYQTPNWFLMLHTDFDNKSIEFTSLKYTQTYLNIRLVAGYRFKTK